MKTKAVITGVLLSLITLSSEASHYKYKKRRGGRSKQVAFDAGKQIFSLGYGLPYKGGGDFLLVREYDNYKGSGLGPIYLKYEYGLTEKLGLGLSANYSNFKATYTRLLAEGETNTKKKSSYSANARLNFHFVKSKNVDLFLGAGVGYRGKKVETTSTDPTFVPGTDGEALIPISFESTLGLRVFFTDNIGWYTELGIAKTYFQTGLVYKL